MVTTTGANNQGIRTNGFIIIGKPKMIGSFTLKIPAGPPNFPNSFVCPALTDEKDENNDS